MHSNLEISFLQHLFSVVILPVTVKKKQRLPRFPQALTLPSSHFICSTITGALGAPCEVITFIFATSISMLLEQLRCTLFFILLQGCCIYNWLFFSCKDYCIVFHYCCIQAVLKDSPPPFSHPHHHASVTITSSSMFKSFCNRYIITDTSII